MKLMYLVTSGRAVEMLKIKSKLYKKRSLSKTYEVNFDKFKRASQLRVRRLNPNNKIKIKLEIEEEMRLWRKKKGWGWWVYS